MSLAIESQRDIQRRLFPLREVLDNSRLLGMLGMYGLKLINSMEEMPEGMDCAAFVLGRENDGHGFLFIPNGRRVNHYVYGAIVSYGLYSYERAADVKIGCEQTLISKDEAHRLLASQQPDDEFQVYFWGTHIGVTTPEGQVLSKWGRRGHVLQHPPHMVPSQYGEAEFFVLPFLVEDDNGQPTEIFIMPQASFEGSNEKMIFLLTDGKQEVGKLVGEKSGSLGCRNSTFIIEKAKNNTQDLNFYGPKLPKLIETAIHFIFRENDLVGQIYFSNKTLFVGETMSKYMQIWNLDFLKELSES